jgi:aminoglycoside/choline kinase family phosphotransferase
MYKKDQRELALQQWVAQLFPGEHVMRLTPLKNDAGFRRYFRLAQSHRTLIAVDSPPETEKNRTFSEISHWLNAHGVCAPTVVMKDFDRGFLCLSDFGDQTLAHVLENTTDTTALYTDAIDTLLKMQQIPTDSLRRMVNYDALLLEKELSIFRYWFLNMHSDIHPDHQMEHALDVLFDQLIQSALSQPQVFVHRDYHARNLMCLGAEYPQSLGLLDFQDAIYGPITYDLVSLLKDAYVDCPPEQLDACLTYYFNQATEQGLLDTDIKTFTHWFQWMGLQRHLKILGIFTRLYHRDKKPGYLQYLPRLYKYIHAICQQDAMWAPLEALITQAQSQEQPDMREDMLQGWDE